MTGKGDGTSTPDGDGRATPAGDEARMWEGETYVTRVADDGDVEASIAVWRAANLARGGPPSAERVERVRAKVTAPDALHVVAVRVAATRVAATRVGATAGPGKVDSEEAGAGADATDRIVGMALGEPARADDGRGAPVPGVLHVAMVFVDPARWGRGLGRQVLDVLTDAAATRGFDRAQLWTGESNTRARRLYASAGFRAGGRRLLLHGAPIVLYER